MVSPTAMTQFEAIDYDIEFRIFQFRISHSPWNLRDLHSKVTIGPVRVESQDQLKAVFAAMKAEPGVKWMM